MIAVFLAVLVFSALYAIIAGGMASDGYQPRGAFNPWPGIVCLGLMYAFFAFVL